VSVSDPLPAAEAEIVDVPAKSRYELRLRGRLIGLLAYRRRDGRIAFTHTEVVPACEGRGFGSRLAEVALEDARRQSLDVVPLCPFIAHFIERHPEYEGLVPATQRVG
jgi:uncharacterized protein